MTERKKISGQTVFLAAMLLLAAAVSSYILLAETLGLGLGRAAAASGGNLTLSDIPFDGAKAYEYLKQICDLGPRPPGSAAMLAQQKLLTDYFQKLGAKVVKQEFRGRDPLSGESLPMTNLIVEWFPERKERILFCAHYDTRPYPDRDRRNPHGKFVGANDGASGVAVLMEMGKSMPAYTGLYGVDFVLLDAEDLTYWDSATDRDTGNFCVGAEYFARNYASDPPPYKYRAAVLLDMVGGTNLRFPKEGHSVEWRDSNKIVNGIWSTAARLKVREFIPQTWGPITDDHVMLHDLGGIPACDIICDFGPMTSYPQWHTQDDDPAHCSPLSLAKVGWVLEEWLKELK
ncbi:MAG TPA: M28 family peptidase [Pirellulales bacterium]